MYYTNKFNTHLVKVTDSYIVKVWSDSIVIQSSPTPTYIAEKYECETEGLPITQETFELEFNKTLENIKNH
jgi:hypothetical protein